MFWWDNDEPHPVRSAEDAKKYNHAIHDLYREMDRVVGDIADQYGDEATIFVMSDHGFCNFRRQFNLNTWLRDNGYLGPSDARSFFNPPLEALVDWHGTRAYGLGLNALYINLAGRERDGIVQPDERDTLLNEIKEKLLAVRDPLNGRPVIAEVDRTDEVYSGPSVSKGAGFDRRLLSRIPGFVGDHARRHLQGSDQ